MKLKIEGALKQLKTELKEYLVNGRIDIDQMLEDFYGYCYLIVRNGVSIAITEEDVEEIISDTFVAMWKNSKHLPETTSVKAYLAGIAKNKIKNKYRKTELNTSLDEFEDCFIDRHNVENITEEKEQEQIILQALQEMKPQEQQIFQLFYYAAKSVQEIAQSLDISSSKVKTTLHRIRKKLKRNLEDGGYGYGR